jgi:hypothetical protein
MFLLAAGCEQPAVEEGTPMLGHAVLAPPAMKEQGGELAGPMADPVQPDSGLSLAYKGGKVMGATKVNLLWYGTWSGSSSTVQIVEDFVQHLGGSPYFNINTGYSDTAGGRVKNQVTFGGSVFLGHFLGDTLSDANIEDVVQFAIANNFVAADPNAVYFVITSQDVDETSGYCTDFCGWHNHGSIAGTDIKFSFIGSGERCPFACEWGATGFMGPNGNAEADTMVSVIAHELEEAATDPDLDAWINNGSPGENGDMCAWDPGVVYAAGTGVGNVHLGSRDYLIQTNWINTPFGGCDHQKILTKPYAPVGSTSNDFNGDTVADILWRNAGSGEMSLWTMFGLTATSKVSLGTPTTAWDVYGVADFNDDKKSDILWYNQSTGQVSIWMMNGSTRTAVVNPVGNVTCCGLPPSGSQLEGVIDLNRDGFADLLWRAPNGSTVFAWLTNGTASASVVTLGLSAPPSWQIRATGDFDHDGNADILWQNTSTDDLSIWYMNGTAVSANPIVHTGASDPGGLPVTILGVGDFNSDGTADILFTGGGISTVNAWLMGPNRAIQSTRVLATRPSSDFHAESTADFSGDGVADVVWRSRRTGEVRMWMVGASAVNDQHIDTPSLPWQIEHN